MKESHFIGLMAVIGLVVGLASFQLAYPGTDEQAQQCNRIADSIRANQSFNGTVACYPPKSDVNQSGEIVNQTDLQCLCRVDYGENERVFAIRKSN